MVSFLIFNKPPSGNNWEKKKKKTPVIPGLSQEHMAGNNHYLCLYFTCVSLHYHWSVLLERKGQWHDTFRAWKSWFNILNSSRISVSHMWPSQKSFFPLHTLVSQSPYAPTEAEHNSDKACTNIHCRQLSHNLCLILDFHNLLLPLWNMWDCTWFAVKSSVAFSENEREVDRLHIISSDF